MNKGFPGKAPSRNRIILRTVSRNRNNINARRAANAYLTALAEIRQQRHFNGSSNRGLLNNANCNCNCPSCSTCSSKLRNFTRRVLGMGKNNKKCKSSKIGSSRKIKKKKGKRKKKTKGKCKK